MAERGVERGAAAWLQVRAQELVDADRRPAVAAARHEAARELLDHRPRRDLEQPELGPQGLTSGASGGRGATPARRETDDPADALGVAEADLERDAAAIELPIRCALSIPLGVEEVGRRPWRRSLGRRRRRRA